MAKGYRWAVTPAAGPPAVSPCVSPASVTWPRLRRVLSGHEHNYERSFAVRGYDPGAPGTVAVPNGQAPDGNAGVHPPARPSPALKRRSTG